MPNLIQYIFLILILIFNLAARCMLGGGARTLEKNGIGSQKESSILDDLTDDEKELNKILGYTYLKPDKKQLAIFQKLKDRKSELTSEKLDNLVAANLDLDTQEGRAKAEYLIKDENFDSYDSHLEKKLNILYKKKIPATTPNLEKIAEFYMKKNYKNYPLADIVLLTKAGFKANSIFGGTEEKLKLLKLFKDKDKINNKTKDDIEYLISDDWDEILLDEKENSLKISIEDAIQLSSDLNIKPSEENKIKIFLELKKAGHLINDVEYNQKLIENAVFILTSGNDIGTAITEAKEMMNLEIKHFEKFTKPDYKKYNEDLKDKDIKALHYAKIPPETKNIKKYIPFAQNSSLFGKNITNKPKAEDIALAIEYDIEGSYFIDPDGIELLKKLNNETNYSQNKSKTKKIINDLCKCKYSKPLNEKNTDIDFDTALELCDLQIYYWDNEKNLIKFYIKFKKIMKTPPSEELLKKFKDSKINLEKRNIDAKLINAIEEEITEEEDLKKLEDYNIDLEEKGLKTYLKIIAEYSEIFNSDKKIPENKFKNKIKIYKEILDEISYFNTLSEFEFPGKILHLLDIDRAYDGDCDKEKLKNLFEAFILYAKDRYVSTPLYKYDEEFLDEIDKEYKNDKTKNFMEIQKDLLDKDENKNKWEKNTFGYVAKKKIIY